MNVAVATWFFALAGFVAWALLLFVVWPRTADSTYRYGLWELRDQIQDDLRAGRIENDAFIQDLQRSIRMRILSPAEWRIARVLTVLLVARLSGGLRFKSLNRSPNPPTSVLHREYLGRLLRQDVKHMAFGSLTGLVLAIIITPAVLLLHARARAKSVLRAALAFVGRFVNPENQGSITTCV